MLDRLCGLPLPPPQLLEMLVKNSVPQFFHHLATSELWAEMLRVGDPVRRVGGDEARGCLGRGSWRGAGAATQACGT